jgi:xylose isomerase
VQQALRDARVDHLREPTLAEGETIEDLRTEVFDLDEARRRGMAFERLD